MHVYLHTDSVPVKQWILFCHVNSAQLTEGLLRVDLPCLEWF